MRTGKTIWIVDAGYLFQARHSISPNYQFDYLKLRNHLEKNGTIDRAYYLNSAPTPPTEQQNAFHAWMRSARPYGPQFIVRLYDLKNDFQRCPSCHHEYHTQVQQGVDVGIATLIIKLAVQDNYDTVILSSGDGDLEDAVAYVKENLNKRVELCVFRNGVSTNLQSYADDVHWINNFSDNIKK